MSPTEPGGPLQRWRLAAALVMAVVLWMALSYTQKLFDQADRRKAVRLVLAPPGGSTALAEALAEANGGAPPSCTARIESSFAGTARVDCAVAQGAFHFDADLVRKEVKPLDAPTGALMARAEALRRTRADGGSGR